MEQLAWTLLALLAATTFGNFYYLGSKIDHLAARINALVGETATIKADLGELRGEVRSLRHSFDTHLRDLHKL